jgi:hypothetical protein
MHSTTMGTQDQYRQRAGEAQRQADLATSNYYRASWLRVVQGWLSLLKKPPQPPLESFDQDLAYKGTQQDETKSSD